ncbi:unnamed protein product, partial [Meganyctiphanes norvegica]
MEKLSEVVQAFNPLVGTRIVMVMCSTNNTIDIFHQIRARTLESVFLQWIVILEEDIIADLQVLLREGAQTTIVFRNNSISENTKLTIYNSYIEDHFDVRFQEIGVWRRGQGQLRSPLVPNIFDIYKDFHGRTITGKKVLKGHPVLSLKGIPEYIHILAQKASHLLTQLFKVLPNLHIRLTMPADRKWGGPEADGSISGFIGLVARHEAHVAAGRITMTYERETVTDFTYPHTIENVIIFSPSPDELSRTFAIFSPYSAWVWLLIIMTVALMGPFLTLLNYPIM